MEFRRFSSHTLKETHALVFMLGTRAIRSIAQTFEVLGETLRKTGFRIYSSIQDSEVVDIPLATKEYRKALKSAPECTHACLLGLGDGAVAIAKNFWDFYAVKFPYAVVFLSANIAPLHLNKPTCPYLIITGDRDPSFEAEPYKRIQEAIYHHQMRYGDLTADFRVEGVGADLTREGQLDPEVITRILDWLPRAASEGLRPQEPAAPAAVA